MPKPPTALPPEAFNAAGELSPIRLAAFRQHQYNNAARIARGLQPLSFETFNQNKMKALEETFQQAEAPWEWEGAKEMEADAVANEPFEGDAVLLELLEVGIDMGVDPAEAPLEKTLQLADAIRNNKDTWQELEALARGNTAAESIIEGLKESRLRQQLMAQAQESLYL